MRNEDETLPAADEGPVQRTVRPRAWWVCAANDRSSGATWSHEPTDEEMHFVEQSTGEHAVVIPLGLIPDAEAVAWALAEEAGDDPGRLIWEGSPPEPWGEVWCRYMPQAERLVKLLFGA